MPQPVMFAVNSSTILSIGYDSEAKALHIIFNGNHEYVYRGKDEQGFPTDLWEKFKDAKSVGTFFAQHIKKQYHGEKLS